jgi:hypothetical protein
MCRHLLFPEIEHVRSNENVYTVKSMEPIFVIYLFFASVLFYYRM